MHPIIHALGRSIPTYGLCLAVAILVGCGWFIWRIKQAHGDVNDMFIICAISIGFGLAGASLLYWCITYDIKEIFEDIISGKFIIFKSGGLVFYGGLIGGVVGFFTGAKITKQRDWNMLANAAAPCLPLAHAIGRMGCFFGGCCFGIHYDGWCAVHLPSHGWVFPVQLLESALNLILSLLLVAYTSGKPKGMQALWLYLILYGIERFLLEFLRGDVIRGLAGGLSTSQWISLIMVAMGAMQFFRHIKAEPSRENI